MGALEGLSYRIPRLLCSGRDERALRRSTPRARELTILQAVLRLSRAIAAKGLLAYVAYIYGHLLAANCLLLRYLEVGGPKSNVYPWAWSLLLLVGPTAVTFCQEWNEWIIVCRRGNDPSFCSDALHV